MVKCDGGWICCKCNPISIYPWVLNCPYCRHARCRECDVFGFEVEGKEDWSFTTALENEEWRRVN